MRVRIRPEYAPYYRKPATALEGVIVGLSRSGKVAQVHLDEVADSFVRVCDLIPLER